MRGAPPFRLLLAVASLALSPSRAAAQGVLFENRSSLAELWELEDSTRHGTFLLRPYKPIYVMPANWTNAPNRQPDNGNGTGSLPLEEAIQAVECKFQFSLKFKMWEGVLGTHGDLWFGYSQSSRWQLYNAGDSRLFRETNYEPEVLLNFPVDVRVLGFQLCMVGGGITHQSNGLSDIHSRSWNRALVQVGLERPGWTVILRPWMRLPESGTDENPRVEEYMGRGDLLVAHTMKGHVVSVLCHHGLFPGPGYGGAQFDWSIPVTQRFNVHLQAFYGYGENLIDFNHEQTTVGVGFSLIEWR